MTRTSRPVRPAPAPRGPRALSRARVVATAIVVIDERGLKDFTLAEVARRLRVQTMALYSYISGRDDLLDAIVEAVLAEVRDDGDLDNRDLDNARQDDLSDAGRGGQRRSEGAGDWQGFLTRSAWEIRRVALAHPEVFPLVATRPPQAPWVRPPLRSLPWMERFVRTLTGFGITRAGTVVIYRAFASFLLGHLLLEVMAVGVDPAPAGEDQHGHEDHEHHDTVQDVSSYPVLAAMEQDMRRDLAAEVFGEALTDLLHRVQATSGGTTG